MKLIKLLAISMILTIQGEAFAFFDLTTANLGLGWHTEGVSDERGYNGQDMLELQSGPRLKLEFEPHIFSTVSLVVGAAMDFGNGRAQYDAINKQTLAPIQLADLKLKFWQFTAHAGLRFRRSIFYIGGGMVVGTMTLIYDTESMKDQLLDLAGVSTEDDASVSGYYAEGGLEFLTSFFGIRMYGQYSSLETGEWKTLDDKKSTYGMGVVGFDFLIPL